MTVVQPAEATTLVVVSVGAFIIPLIFGRMRLPAAVGEILFGIVISRHALGLATSSPLIDFLATFGFVLLMFLAGLEIDFMHVDRMRRRNIATAAGVPLLTLVASGVVVLALGLSPILILVLSAVSVGIMLVTLAERGLSKSSFGQVTILVGSFGEILSIVLLTAAIIYLRTGLSTLLLVEMAKLGAIFCVGYVLLVVLRTLVWWFPDAFGRLVAARDPAEIGVRAGMATMMIFAGLAYWLGLEPFLGSFVAGAIFAFVFRDKRNLESKLSSIGFGFFIPIFFIYVGMEFELVLLLRSEVYLLSLLLLGLSLGCKILPAMLLKTQGLSLREATGAGLLLSAPLTLVVAIAEAAHAAGAIDHQLKASLILLAILTGLVPTVVFRFLHVSPVDAVKPQRQLVSHGRP